MQPSSSGAVGCLLVLLIGLLAGCGGAAQATPRPTATVVSGTPTLMPTIATPVPAPSPGGTPTSPIRTSASAQAASPRTRHTFSEFCDRAREDARLYYQRRVYGLAVDIFQTGAGVSSPPGTPPFALEPTGDALAAPWQVTGGEHISRPFPPGTPIQRVSGIPATELLAIQDSTRIFLYCPLPASRALADTVVVQGVVARTLPNPICEQNGCGSPDVIELRQTVEVTIGAVWHGQSVGEGQMLTVIAWGAHSDRGRLGELQPGANVALLVRRLIDVEDYRPIKNLPNRPPTEYWVAEAQNVYTVAEGQAHWASYPVIAIPLYRFRADLAATFGDLP